MCDVRLVVKCVQWGLPVLHILYQSFLAVHDGISVSALSSVHTFYLPLFNFHCLFPFLCLITPPWTTIHSLFPFCLTPSPLYLHSFIAVAKCPLVISESCLPPLYKHADVRGFIWMIHGIFILWEAFTSWKKAELIFEKHMMCLPSTAKQFQPSVVLWLITEDEEEEIKKMDLLIPIAVVWKDGNINWIMIFKWREQNFTKIILRDAIICFLAECLTRNRYSYLINC